MSEPAWHIEYLDEPGEWHDNGRPFRCDFCHKMRPSSDGRWVHRWPGTPGHFVAVCAIGTGCARTWRRWFGR